jgi:hypothetical protein
MIGTTALMVAGGIAAAGQAAGAINSARASKKAGEQQAAGARQARGAVDESYKVQMGLMDPYAALGRQSANTLGRLMQPGVGYSPEMQAMDAMAFQNAPSPWNMPPPADPRAGQRPSGMTGRLQQMLAAREMPQAGPPPAFMPFAAPPMAGPSRIPPARYRTMGTMMPGRAA